MSTTVADPPLPPGANIDGRYVVGEVIGRGGGGVVCAGKHLALDAAVAIKFLRASELPRDARKRFLREARLSNRVRSEHAIRVYDVGELPSGELYLVMERLYGRALDAELAIRGPLPDAEVATLAAQACEALGEAHSLGIVHRDVKPANLFLHLEPSAVGSRPVLKVLDFGLSRELDVAGTDPPHTRTFMFLGTPRYMPPEQWEVGASADPRMDIYAMGVVIHELLTGRVPFESLPPEARAAAILGGAVPDPRLVRADVSTAMAEIVMACVKPMPEHRIPSMRHLESLLRAAAASSPSTSGGTLVLSEEEKMRPRNSTAEPARTRHDAIEEEDEPRPVLDKIIIAVLVSLLLVLVALSVVALYKTGGRF